MNFRNKLVHSIAAATMVLGLGASVAFAGEVDSETKNAGLNMICPTTNTVDLTIGGDFTVNAASGFSGSIAGIPYYHSDTLTDNFTVVMDLTCNWSDDFSVDAEIGAFNHDGATTPAPGTVTTFGGSHLYLTSGGGNYVGPNIFGVTDTPDIETNVFPNIWTTDGPMIENGSFLWLDFAAPGVTTAKWDGQLRFLPANLADGHYEAPLTVTLSVD